MKTLISQKMTGLLNMRIQKEQQSSRLYKAMSVCLNLKGFSGASKLWQSYSDEELDHAQWAYDYLLQLNIKPITPSQDQPENEFGGLVEIVNLSYDHEIQIKDECVNLVKVCLIEGDMLTLGLAQKYVEEQIGEIAKMQYWKDRIECFGSDNIALRMLDNEMGNF